MSESDHVTLSVEQYLEMMRGREQSNLSPEGQPTNRPHDVPVDHVKTRRIMQENIEKFGTERPEIHVTPTRHVLGDGRHVVRVPIPGMREAAGFDEFEFVGDTAEEAWDGMREWMRKLTEGTDHGYRRAEFEYAVRTRKIS